MNEERIQLLEEQIIELKKYIRTLAEQLIRLDCSKDVYRDEVFGIIEELEK